MIGDTYQLFRGLFCCHLCQRKVDKREYQFLKHASENETFTEEQRERLTVLQKRQKNNATVIRRLGKKRKMETGGEVPEAKRVSGREGWRSSTGG